MNSKTYKKRTGTSGIQGQLYETKLISLIYFRLTHDDSVEQFSLATNRDDIGAFDDICLKIKVNGFDKPLAVFIQAKHRENDKLLTFTSKTDLAKYFDSYLEIRRAFEPSSKDMIFGGQFDKTECFFVMYTTAKDDPNNKKYEGSSADYLNELIGTGGCCTQPSYRDEDLEFLCKIVIHEQIKTLAEQLGQFICDESDNEMSMNNDLILRYHVILALYVLDVSEIQPEGYRIASFKQDFFTANQEFIVLFKNILYLEVLKTRKSEDSETDIQSLVLKFISEPSEAKTLSKLIGSVITYKNNRLEFVNKSMTDDLKRQLKRVNVPQSTVYEAVEMAVKECLLSLNLKVPAFFGNKDLAIRGKHDKITKRLNHLTTKITEILKQSNPNNIVTIDESLGEGLLQLNGGIASAVGNVLVFDETSKLLKFTDNSESLGTVAKTWYEKLKSNIENLHEYKLDVKVKIFPKLTFEQGEYDMNLVRDFYNKLLFYTNQADQNGVEKILKTEIEDHPCSDVNNFRVRSDVIFLKFHDVIQRMWMTPKMGSYLTKKSKIYDNAVTNAMSEPVMDVMNTMHNIKNQDYTFNERAIKQFELHGQILGTIITSECCILTIAKLKQFLGKKDFVVLEFEYIVKLPLKVYTTLCKELTNTTKEKIIIIVCNNFQDSGSYCKKLENIANAVDNNQIIIITSQISVAVITKLFKTYEVLNDERNILTDMSRESQAKLLETSKVKYQGEILSLNVIVDDENVHLVDHGLLNQIINNEIIVVGKTFICLNYEKIQTFYVDRRVSRTKKQEQHKFDDVKDMILKTLYDFEDSVVVITAIPRMGMSTLLTHLSLKTKHVNAKVWIARIQFWEHEYMLRRWQEKHTVMNTLETLTFLCEAELGEVSGEHSKEDEVCIKLEDSPNGSISLVKCSGSHRTEFQLKMFLHFYNTGKLIFLFEDFFVIFPKYETEAIALLNSVRSYPRKHKIWITSRSPHDSLSILEQEFGSSYVIEHLTSFEKDTYLETYRKSIQVENLNEEQIKNAMHMIWFILNIEQYEQENKI